MNVSAVPVDERTRSAAHWALYILLGVPTIAALVVGAILRVSGRAQGESFSGLLMWVVIIGLIQFAIVAVGRSQYMTGVSMRVEEAPRAIQIDPGIFHHE